MLLASWAAFAETPNAKPNVLFIMIDDLRPELGCYDAPQVKTPNIDRLAAQGLVFERAYCQVPVCGASRASLMTGILPTESRFTDFLSRADEDVPDAMTLPQVFKDAGYTTLSNGKVFHASEDAETRSWSKPAWRPSDLPFLYSLDPETTTELAESGRGRIFEYPDVSDDAYADGKVAQKTIEDLGRLKSLNEPFFLACGFVRPHMPFYAPKKYWDLYERENIVIADNRFRPNDAPMALRGSGEHKQYTHGAFEEGTDEWHRMMRHGYYASTSYVDKLTGDVLNELNRLGLAENTIVVIWGDHGWHLGEHDFWGKHNTLHNAIRVPLIIKGPGIAADQKTTSLVESVDIFPTLCSLAGLSTPSTAQGQSFEPLLSLPAQKFRDFVYTRFKSADAIVTDRFVYTRYLDDRRMLYDLQEDPDENQNVIDEAVYEDVVKDLDQMLQTRRLAARDLNINPEKSAQEVDTAVPAPTLAEARYGEHERHVLDFWKADSSTPTPLAFVIHGGGWKGGTKERVGRFVEVDQLLEAGISVVAINYRLVSHATDAGIEPPVKAPLHDAARALQFVRSKAVEWNIDKQRIGAAGGSAGACSSLWLAYHDDLADPDSSDPIARESTRLQYAAVIGAQTTLDPKQMKEWTPNSKYGGHAFGKDNFEQFLHDRDSILPWIAEYSPYALVTADDPPVCLLYSSPPARGQAQRDPTHTSNFGAMLLEKCNAAGAACEFIYSADAGLRSGIATDYLIENLK